MNKTRKATIYLASLVNAKLVTDEYKNFIFIVVFDARLLMVNVCVVSSKIEVLHLMDFFSLMMSLSKFNWHRIWIWASVGEV